MDKTFTLYWHNGVREFVTGPNFRQASVHATQLGRAALDWFDNGASESHVFLKGEGGNGRWVKRGPTNLHRDDVATWPIDEFIRMFKTSSEIRVQLRNGSWLVARQCYGQFATLGWIKYIEIFYIKCIEMFYGERRESEDDGETAFNVHTPVYFDPTDFDNAIACLRMRVAAAVENSENAIRIESPIPGAKSLEEIKDGQETIPL